MTFDELKKRPPKGSLKTQSYSLPLAPTLSHTNTSQR